MSIQNKHFQCALVYKNLWAKRFGLQIIHLHLLDWF